MEESSESRSGMGRCRKAEALDGVLFINNSSSDG